MFVKAKTGVALLAVALLPYLASAVNTSHNLTGVTLNATGFPPCDALISAGLGDRLLLATSAAYETRVQSWWSANARLRPWCFVQPHTAHEVSIAISALANIGSGAGDWHIAVRSGGHNYPGSSNIANGATIDLGKMNHSNYDPVRKIASVGPGGAFKDVYYNLLHRGNVTITGGRDGGVGVGGFLLGGGLSYYTGRNGLGCDNVVNFEVVLANGTIINASNNEHRSLWKALKGGGANFGIVTRYDVQAMPAEDLAYGQSVVTSNHSDEVIDALVEFTDHPEKLADDALITLYTHQTNTPEDVTIILIRVNTKGNLNTTSFNRVNAIPTLQKSWSLMSLADAANFSQIPAGTKNSQTTLTLLNSPQILRKCASLHAQMVSSLSAAIGAGNFKTQMILQPFPKYFGRIGQRKGGNMLGIESLPSNAIIWVAGVSITNGDDVALAVAQAELNAMTSKLKELALGGGAAERLVYLNYAAPNQDPLGSYGQENLEFMNNVARLYDPKGLWQQRVPGGFKLSRVHVSKG